MEIRTTRVRTIEGAPTSEVHSLIRRIPEHVGIMMDGNGRWARRRGMTRLAGHRVGTENVQRVLEACEAYGIGIVTLYVFSTENWSRPKDEIDGFFSILQEVIDRETPRFHRRGVQLRHLGSLDGVPPDLAAKVRGAVELTRNNGKYILNVAFNYGGRDEILRAIKGIIRAGVLPEAVDEELFDGYLYTDGLPDIDLIIRTGDELRLSNFFPWQAARAVYFASPVYWPDFDDRELQRALIAFNRYRSHEPTEPWPD